MTYERRRKTSTLGWKNFYFSDVTFSALAVEPRLSEEYQHMPEKSPSSTTEVEVMSKCMGQLQKELGA